MNMKRVFFSLFLACLAGLSSGQQLTGYVNPLLGTATLWEPEDLGYVRTWKQRTWGAEVFPGSSLPNAMVQCTPVTMYHSGAGYQYEDQTILGFGHTAKGHWGGLHVPFLPATGRFGANDYASAYSHANESAQPGYYQVYLERYHVNAELTTTLRCAFHRYTFRPDDEKFLLADMTHSNNDVRDWSIQREGEHAFSGSQNGEGRIFFYATTNYAIRNILNLQNRGDILSVVCFDDSRRELPLEVRVGFSFVSIDNARMNLEAEMLNKSFNQVRTEADQQWEALLRRIQVQGGTERQRRLFYSTLYRSLLWPSLRSDVNGQYRDARDHVVSADFNYYTDPSFWDDYRNKDILLGLLRPDVMADVIMSCIDRGEKRGGYFPTFFHGDHGAAVVAGNWLRGVRRFDMRRAYTLLYNNAFKPGPGGRPFLDEYLRRGWIAEKDTTNVPTQDEYKAAVTKTVEYAYDDYATALIARELREKDAERELRLRSMNYKKLFDPSTGFWRGRIDDGSWIQDFRPYYPYFAYQYREANAWNSLFFAPHDPQGVVKLYPSKRAVELKLDSLFSQPWRGYEVHNMTGFIGNYCHGNQPGHSIPYMYYFIDRQEKSQLILDSIMNRFYDMGRHHLAYAGMDDAGEMSSWYVFNAIGLYTYSPADPQYIVTVPLFPRILFTFPDGHTTEIVHQGAARHKITRISVDGRQLKGWFLQDKDLKRAKRICIQTK
ncbi:MAG: GH92 family glycosyl hydrolase [Bacteroidaceae bacterium]|nr:GH92 family glycosyl hydrolase [Bacteroidaceae bacterium]